MARHRQGAGALTTAQRRSIRKFRVIMQPGNFRHSTDAIMRHETGNHVGHTITLLFGTQ